MEEKKLTGYPSIDKPWLQYYSEEAKNKAIPRTTAYAYMKHCNADNQEGIAINYYGTKVTYEKLFDKINQVANAFLDNEVKSGDIVALCTATFPEAYYVFYALNLIGAAANVIDPRTSAQGVLEYLKQSQCKFVVTLDACLDKIFEIADAAELQTIVAFSPSESLPLFLRALYRLKNGGNRAVDSNRILSWRAFLRSAGTAEVNPAPFVSERLAAIVHTGGTTGMPKGVRLTNENFVAMACQFGGDDQSIDMPLPFRRGWKNLNIMPPFLAYGLCTCMYMFMCRGMENILIPNVDAQVFPMLLKKYKPEVFAGSPPFYEEMVKSSVLKKMDMSFFKNPVVGGDAVHLMLEEKVNRFLKDHGCKSKICKGYGLTEVGGMITVCTNQSCNALGSVGIPTAYNNIAVFDVETHEELPYGLTGEVCMQTPTMMQGYEGNPEETGALIRRHKDGSVWLHPMDLGHIDENGLLYLEGRIKRIIVSHIVNWKVYPLQIENVVMTHPSVETCAVIGKSLQETCQGEKVVAYVVLLAQESRNASKVRQEVYELCKQKLNEYSLPEELYFIDALPLTPNGKVDYRALEQMERNKQPEV